jgi:hypothetical protein
LEDRYKEIHEDLREMSKQFVLVDGMIEVHKDEHENHYYIKNPEPYISLGMCDVDYIKEQISENEIDGEDWSEGLYEFSYLMMFVEGEYDEMGRPTAPEYHEVVSEEYTLLTTFEQMNRTKILDELLDNDINEIFEF